MWLHRIAEVKRFVPAERLLIFDVREGWAPLCDFLGVEQPTEPFPHYNKREQFRSRTVARASTRPAQAASTDELVSALASLRVRS